MAPAGGLHPDEGAQEFRTAGDRRGRQHAGCDQRGRAVGSAITGFEEAGALAKPADSASHSFAGMTRGT